MFDSSLRVPGLVRYPGVIPAGSVVDGWTSNLDWFPTLCDAAGVEQDEAGRELLRGRSIWAALRGKSHESPPRELYFEYSMRHGSQVDMRAIRTDKWKYIRDYRHPGRSELYDLEADPHERTNLVPYASEEQRKVMSEFDAKLFAKMVELNDPLAEE